MASPEDRVQRVLDEIEGVASTYGVTSWEKNEFLPSIRTASVLTEKRERVLREIEEKVFGEDYDPDEDEK